MNGPVLFIYTLLLTCSLSFAEGGTGEDAGENRGSSGDGHVTEANEIPSGSYNIPGPNELQPEDLEIETAEATPPEGSQDPRKIELEKIKAELSRIFDGAEIIIMKTRHDEEESLNVQLQEARDFLELMREQRVTKLKSTSAKTVYINHPYPRGLVEDSGDFSLWLGEVPKVSSEKRNYTRRVVTQALLDGKKLVKERDQLTKKLKKTAPFTISVDPDFVVPNLENTVQLLRAAHKELKTMQATDNLDFKNTKFKPGKVILSHYWSGKIVHKSDYDKGSDLFLSLHEPSQNESWPVVYWNPEEDWLEDILDENEDR